MKKKIQYLLCAHLMKPTEYKK